MDLLEYQAKKLFRQVGIPILPSQTIEDPRQIKQLQIPYPVVLKSQVRAGGRGKAGGVKFVENTIDAIAAARSIFNLSILEEYPDVILAEARYDAHKELFLAIALDYELKRPVLLGSSSGGMDVQLLLKNLQKVVIETEFAPFHARRLASQMNLSGNLLLAVSKIIEKMYGLFQAKDLELVEINPLGVNSEGHLMALDGKMTINDHALSRHPDIISLTERGAGVFPIRGQAPAYPIEVLSESVKIELNGNHEKSKVQSLDWQNPQGNIAIITNDFDLAILGWDLISQAKKKPACGIILEHFLGDEQKEAELFCTELEDVLNQLNSFENIQVVLINFWGTENFNTAIAKTIFDYYQTINDLKISISDNETNTTKQNEAIDGKKTTSPKVNSPTSASSSIKFIVRLLDEKIQYYQEEYKTTDIYWTNSLEEAISKI
ncbi:MAG: ATP-grasp domain-containing protein [Xenococcus sp. (in: cyanobacteria)]